MDLTHRLGHLRDRLRLQNRTRAVPLDSEKRAAFRLSDRGRRAIHPSDSTVAPAIALPEAGTLRVAGGRGSRRSSRVSIRFPANESPLERARKRSIPGRSDIDLPQGPGLTAAVKSHPVSI